MAEVTPALELRGVVRDYGKGVRVGPISYSAEPGSFVSVLGPSGCGKTTLLRCIAGFEPIDEGALLIDGRNVSAMPAHRRDIGLVFQNYALFPHLTVAENVGFGLKLRKVAKPDRDKRITDALDIVGLVHLAERMPSQISGGQQQRVAIARSLVLQPSILLLDEPLSNLDYKLRLQMRRELRALQRRLGMTFIFVTHDQSEALALSDKVVVLSEGRIEQVGSPADIYDRPRSRFVADFIGSANLLKVRRVTPAANGMLWAELEIGGRIMVQGGEVPQGSTWVAIRPEHLHPTTDSADSADGSSILSGRPVSQIFAGDRTEVTLQLDETSDSAPTHVMCYVEPRFPLGEMLNLRVAPTAAVLVGGAN